MQEVSTSTSSNIRSPPVKPEFSHCIPDHLVPATKQLKARDLTETIVAPREIPEITTCSRGKVMAACVLLVLDINSDVGDCG
ncbi:hypothetical protein N7520_005667 [Penicillium odoratum]|uniref:uncharacterized protein n=1 Tax=Penicillium odoratum TaxID=1167516 RepID=UPI002546A4C4|nr:uncharacterized protein N7520_005667 [Penicillium odoratum]KAJ5758511.1 hypothetical protein N7520_005667 [Penicillium odoratum]